jgi:hypothetical protein
MLEMSFMGMFGLGLIMVCIGRHIMIRDTGGDLPLVWIVALRLIPFSELIYMVRHYAQAKTGGIVSIIGMWLMVPWIGQGIWERENHVKAKIAQYAKAMDTAEDGDGMLTPAMLADMPAEAAVAYRREQSERMAAKTEKIGQLNARLTGWFAELQKKRAALTNDEPMVRVFNAEAAAYAAFNAVAKEENAEFAEMQKVVAGRKSSAPAK